MKIEEIARGNHPMFIGAGVLEVRFLLVTRLQQRVKMKNRRMKKRRRKRKKE